MKFVASQLIASCFLFLAWVSPSIAAQGDEVASWMLLLTTRNGAVAIAPTTYDTADECGAVVNALTWNSGVAGACLPARMTDAFVASYAAKQVDEAAAYFAKAAQLNRDRPVLEAEKRQIEAVPVEKRTKAQMDRLTEIERRFDALN